MAKLSDGASNGRQDEPPPSESDAFPSGRGPRQDFTIVGIGASAGGLSAIERFMKAAPSDANCAYVVIQHLDPTHESMLPELIARFASMPVSVAEDRTPIDSNHVYTAPPGKDISVLRGVLRVSAPPPGLGIRMPIDHFLRSLADDRFEMAVGVILSGTGSDGTLGLRAIKERGGLALAQEPSTAQFDGMPRNAIDEGLVDIVAPPEELPAEIIEHRLRAPLISNAEFPFAASRKAIEKIIILLRSRSGNDFSLYKKSTLYRRIERRMGIHGIPSVDAYVSLLERNPVEIDILFKELLIGVTSFFRDAQSWEALSSLVVRPLLERTKSGRGLRAWSVGCSTGEEPYSLAIAFREAGAGSGGAPRPAVKIFATDLDGDVIAKARLGYFTESAMADLPGELRGKYFAQEDGGFRVRNTIREMVVFAPHNLLLDPPYTKLDLVCCRNLLIYLTPEQQRRIIPLLHYSLEPGGFLFLGNAESVGCFTDLFVPLDKGNRIYRRSDAPRSSAMAGVKPEAATGDIREAADQAPLESFVVSEANDELQSANEELQSANEELMTSREEMQSLNEELRTVNAELQARVEDLVAVGDDVRELLDSTDISMIILDDRLRVRRYTKRAAELTRLIPADIGRVVTDIATDLIYPDLAEDSMKALREDVVMEREVRSKDGSWFVSRVMPHRTRDKAVDGAVIVFSDISRLKLLEAELERAKGSDKGPKRD